MSQAYKTSPLNHRANLVAHDKSVSLSERPFVGKHILRVKQPNAAKGKIELPIANRVLQSNGSQILWLGPDEWMFVTPPNTPKNKGEDLATALAGLHHQFVDVSDYYTIIRLSGKRSEAVLMKICTIDLHPRMFKPGHIAGTVCGKANIWLLKNRDDETEFDLFIRWSMADYLWCLIAEAGREFGLEAQAPFAQEKGLRYK